MRPSFSMPTPMQLIAAGILAAIGAPANSASFDCARSTTRIEKFICDDQALSTLDERVEKQYRMSIRNTDSRDAKAKMRRGQHAWLKRRDACEERACIETAYRGRAEELTYGAGRQSSDRLSVVGKTHKQAAAARLPAPQDAPALPVFASFKLTKGRGVTVCEAYVERLNRTWYETYPWCDRTENDAVPGFRKLQRVPLTPAEMRPFWAPVSFFLLVQDPDRWKVIDESHRKLNLPRPYGPEQQLNTIRGESSLQVYRFEPPMDIDNDGKSDPVVMWRAGQCGYIDGALPRSWLQVPIVLNATGDGPDVEKTRTLVGHPVDGYRVPSGKLSERFRLISGRMAVFSFEGIHYIDGFFDEWGDFANQRRSDPEISNTLGVFVAQGGKTRQVCELHLEDFIDCAGVSMRKQAAAAKRDKPPR